MPALFTNTRGEPSESMAFANPASFDMASRTSTRTPMAFPPALPINPAVSSAEEPKSAQPTANPRRASSSAISRPSPLPAPVTKATLWSVTLVLSLLSRKKSIQERPPSPLPDEVDGDKAKHSAENHVIGWSSRITRCADQSSPDERCKATEDRNRKAVTDGQCR